MRSSLECAVVFSFVQTLPVGSGKETRLCYSELLQQGVNFVIRQYTRATIVNSLTADQALSAFGHLLQTVLSFGVKNKIHVCKA